MVLCKTSTTDTLLYLRKGRHIKKTPKTTKKQQQQINQTNKTLKSLKKREGGASKKFNFLNVKKKNGFISAKGLHTTLIMELFA